ncbi:MAG: ribbon-helix-helix protein, CopG family [Gammaproteobacteria bacterium]|nr:ribbon-helix-helix protein, CopG family [Gammaproteobacteria bacterium]
MPRLTISLSEETHAALKETAARQGRSITALIEESLRFRGLKSIANAKKLVNKVRQRSQLSADEAMDIALNETRASRNN